VLDDFDMPTDLDRLLDAQGGVATTAQLLQIFSRSRLDIGIRDGELMKVWPGVYSREEPDALLRLRGLDLRAREPVAVCLGTAAAAYGFDTEEVDDLHVLNPVGHQLRNSDGLIVHRRDDAPLSDVDGRLATTPEWTAVEVARALRRPRALATLDAALRSGTCDRRQLRGAADRQAGRRGIVHVRELIPLAAPEAESPMESEARLAMLDGGLPPPVLQHEIVDRNGRTWRVDFALARAEGRRRIRRLRLAQRSRAAAPRPSEAGRPARDGVDRAVDRGRRRQTPVLGHGAPHRD
jgi:hypothetical protein